VKKTSSFPSLRPALIFVAAAFNLVFFIVSLALLFSSRETLLRTRIYFLPEKAPSFEGLSPERISREAIGKKFEEYLSGHRLPAEILPDNDFDISGVDFPRSSLGYPWTSPRVEPILEASINNDALIFLWNRYKFLYSLAFLFLFLNGIFVLTLPWILVQVLESRPPTRFLIRYKLLTERFLESEWESHIALFFLGEFVLMLLLYPLLTSLLPNLFEFLHGVGRGAIEFPSFGIYSILLFVILFFFFAFFVASSRAKFRLLILLFLFPVSETFSANLRDVARELETLEAALPAKLARLRKDQSLKKIKIRKLESRRSRGKQRTKSLLKQMERTDEKRIQLSRFLRSLGEIRKDVEILKTKLIGSILMPAPPSALSDFPVAFFLPSLQENMGKEVKLRREMKLKLENLKRDQARASLKLEFAKKEEAAIYRLQESLMRALKKDYEEFEQTKIFITEAARFLEAHKNPGKLLPPPLISGKIYSRFGKKRAGKRGPVVHMNETIIMPTLDPRVFAPVGGLIIHAGPSRLSPSLAVAIRKNDTLYVFFNLDRIEVRKGDRIRAGRVIGVLPQKKDPSGALSIRVQKGERQIFNPEKNIRFLTR